MEHGVITRCLGAFVATLLIAIATVAAEDTQTSHVNLRGGNSTCTCHTATPKRCNSAPGQHCTTSAAQCEGTGSSQCHEAEGTGSSPCGITQPECENTYKVQTCA